MLLPFVMTNLLQVVKNCPRQLYVLFLVIIFVFPSCRKATTYEFDLIISNGNVIDGSGSLWFPADVAIRGEDIVEIGKIPDKEKRSPKIIEAQDLIVSPGFIDIQRYSDSSAFIDKFSKNKIYQGITSEILVDGIPTGSAQKGLNIESEKLNANSSRKKLGIYFNNLIDRGISINVGTYVGLHKILQGVLGSSKRKVNPSDISEIKELIREEMVDGALGLSNSFSKLIKESMTPNELIVLAGVVAKYGGIYSAYIRGKKKELQSAIKETVRISNEANIPTDIINLEFTDESFIGQAEQIIKIIDKYRATGVLMTMTQSPYLAEKDESGLGIISHVQEQNVISVLKVDWVSIGSGGKSFDPNKDFISRKIHPQSYGAFPRVLGKFIRDKGISDVETTIKKMTWLNAKKLGLQNRGLIKIGNKADITIFDPKTINDNATFENPQEFSSGIQYVIVNGVLVLEAGKYLANQPGKILFGKGRIK